MGQFLKIIGGSMQQKQNKRTKKKKKMKMNAWSMFKSLRVKIHIKKPLRNSWLQVSYKNWLKPICQLVCFPEMTEFDHCDSWLGPVSMGNVQDAPAYIQNLKIIPYLLYIWGLMTQTQRGIMYLLNVTLPQQLATTDNIDPRCTANSQSPRHHTAPGSSVHTVQWHGAP